MGHNNAEEYKGKYKTAHVEITTEVAGDAHDVQLNTIIFYRWNGTNKHGDALKSSETHQLRCIVRRSDEDSLMDSWDALFDRVARVQQTVPKSLTWKLSWCIGEGEAEDVAAMLRIAAHELKIPLRVEVDRRQMVVEELGIGN